MISISFTVTLALTILTMLVQTTKSLQLRVAVLGSGIAGSTAARTLADRGVQVTVFEAGHGIGGRTSTRITRDDNQYQFDHGAQYISKPKTDLFQDALDQWKGNGWVKDWSGNFGTAGRDPTEQVQLEVDEKKERWVGYPAMHSISQNLLDHENIKVVLHTRADAMYKGEEQDSTTPWELSQAKSKENLGSFDWLVVTDRNSGLDFVNDLTHANVDKYTSGIRAIQSVKSLTAMVVFEKPLGLGMDGITFDETSKDAKDRRYGSLGWAARDTSKPGRDREDGKECWVLQSHPDAANEIFAARDASEPVRVREEDGKVVQKIKDIRELAKDVLVQDFLKNLATLAGDKHVDLPLMAKAIGHSWSAAFPILSPEYKEMDSQLIAEKRFVACGDYFGALSGRVEGAYLSGLSAANQLCHENDIQAIIK
jgi:renalase